MLKQNKFKRALVIGSGSGRDFASAVLLTERLRRSGAKVDLAGFLTPWAMHTFEGKLEQPLNRLTRNSNKFRPNLRYDFLSGYFEPLLLDLNFELGLGIRDMYLFSLQHGLERLAEALQGLVSSRQYDLIVAADVGGDILARPADYNSVRTPIVDQSCLRLLQTIESDAKLVVAVVSPGVDGEIPLPRMADIIEGTKREGACLGEEHYFEDEAFQRFISLNEAINSRSGSYSHTFRMIRQMSLQANGSKAMETYLHEIKIANQSWMIRSQVELDPDLIRKIFYFDLKGLPAADISYRNLFDAFLAIKWSGAGGTEIDLSHIPMGLSDSKYDGSLYMLSPASSIKGQMREEMLLEGLRLIHTGQARKLIVHQDDLALLGIYPGLALYSVNGYCFMGEQ